MRRAVIIRPRRSISTWPRRPSARSPDAGRAVGHTARARLCRLTVRREESPLLRVRHRAPKCKCSGRQQAVARLHNLAFESGFFIDRFKFKGRISVDSIECESCLETQLPMTLLTVAFTHSLANRHGVGPVGLMK